MVKNDDNAESRPTPDPTILTTEQLIRENRSLREILEARLNGIDKSINTIEHGLGERQSVIDAAIEHQKSFFEVKFDGVEKQFTERDKRTEQLSIADKTAIAAALQAQKEAAGAQNESNTAAVSKQEAAFTKLLESAQQSQTAMNKSMDDKINDVKSRLDKGEGHTKGATDSYGIVVGAIGVLIAVATLAMLVITRVPH